MFKRSTLRNLTALVALAGTTTAVGCDKNEKSQSEDIGVAQSEITDVAHTAVERQSIGNCWLYAQASWVESLRLSYQQANAGTGASPDTCEHDVCTEGGNLDSACNTCATAICQADEYCCNNSWDNLCTGAVEELCGVDACTAEPGGGEPAEIVELDVSQSYWTYWHWFDQVTGYMYEDKISTGGNQWKSHGIVRDRGLMSEGDFVPEDVSSEMPSRQSSAESKINTALKSGELSTREARQDGKLVRKVFDEAWGLSDEVRAQLDKVFGEDGEGTLRDEGSVAGTNIIHPGTLKVRYTKRSGDSTETIDTNLLSAVKEWNTVRYPRSANDRRAFLQRVQRALHDRQPLVITWDVDFNAMENGQNERRGSFNLTTLANAGKPGSQGGHMTVLEDYEVETTDFGLLKAGETLDPVADADKLAAALDPTSKIVKLRTKNSWGALRPDRAFAPDFPGYHDLAMDYLNGPIKFCPSVDNATNENGTGESIPLRDIMLPPGY
jgi:hypothetical protein